MAVHACHPEAAEWAAQPRAPNEGPLHLVGTSNAASEYTGPSVRKERGPQDDKWGRRCPVIAHFGMISTVYYTIIHLTKVIR
jgi:hypothetical protein